MSDDFDFDVKEVAGFDFSKPMRLRSLPVGTIYRDCDGSLRTKVEKTDELVGNPLYIAYPTPWNRVMIKSWGRNYKGVVEAVEDDLFGEDDLKDITSNIESAREFVEENLTEENGLWVLASYSKFYGGAAGRANVQYFKDNYPNVIQVVGGYVTGEETVGIPEEKLGELTPATMQRLSRDLATLQDQVYISDAHYADAEQELRDRAWSGWINRQFMQDLNHEFPQFEEQLWDLDAEGERRLFEALRDYTGAEWYEGTDGDQYVNVDDILKGTDEKALRDFLFKEPGAQLQLNLESLINGEPLQEGREFSCVLAPAPSDLRDYVLRWGQMNVTDDEVYDDDAHDYGREDDPHVTVKFGLHEARPSEELLKIIESTQPFEIEVGAASFFESSAYDVLKFDVTGEGLYELNRRISEAIECTDTHPEYHAHLTVAYVQKGCCRDLEGKTVVPTDNPAAARFLVRAVKFSSKDGNKYTLFLGKPNEDIEGTGPVHEALSRRSFMKRLGAAMGGLWIIPVGGAAVGAGEATQQGWALAHAAWPPMPPDMRCYAKVMPDGMLNWVWDRKDATIFSTEQEVVDFAKQHAADFKADYIMEPAAGPDPDKEKQITQSARERPPQRDNRSRFDYAGGSEDTGYSLYQESASVPNCRDCGRPTHGEYYRLRDDVWAETGVNEPGMELCIGCVENRLGRRLTYHDFDRIQLNTDPDIPRSPRLKDRLSEAVPRWAYRGMSEDRYDYVKRHGLVPEFEDNSAIKELERAETDFESTRFADEDDEFDDVPVSVLRSRRLYGPNSAKRLYFADNYEHARFYGRLVVRFRWPADAKVREDLNDEWTIERAIPPQEVQIEVKPNIWRSIVRTSGPMERPESEFQTGLEEALQEAQGGTVVIHLDDRSTDFLKAIYEGHGYPVVNGGISPQELMEVIKNADRLYMMGHGAPQGLFGDGYMIGDQFGPLLREKKDGVYIWCNADAYAARNKLSGLVSGMFISEVGEANYFGIQATQEQVDASNNAFARICREVIDRGDPYSAVRDCYAASNAACVITQFNAERLYVFNQGEPTPVLHQSSAYHQELRYAKDRKDWDAQRADREAKRKAWRDRAAEGESTLYRLRGQLASAAQTVYDQWEQDEEGIDPMLGAGGLCQDIADVMVDVLSANGIEATIVDTSVGDQHVWAMAHINDVVFSVDIPPSVYETGSGYVWKKRQGVTFEPDDVLISPEDVSWDEITESMNAANEPFDVLLMARYDGKYILQYDEGRFRISDDNQGKGYTHQEAQAKADEIRRAHGFSFEQLQRGPVGKKT